jgi:hypothetical protein
MKFSTTLDITQYMEKILIKEGKKEVSKKEFDSFLKDYDKDLIARPSSFLPIKVSIFDKEDYINLPIKRYCPIENLEKFPNLRIGKDDIAFEVDGHYFIKYKEGQHDMHNKSIFLFEKWFDVKLDDFFGIPICFYLLEGKDKKPQIAVNFCLYGQEIYLNNKIVGSLTEIFGFSGTKAKSFGADLYCAIDFIYDVPEQFHKEWKDFREQKDQIEKENIK